MTISGRVPLLLLLGLVPALLRPQMSTVWMWVGLVIALTLVDWLLTPAPAALELTRRPVGTTRHATPTSTTLVARNTSKRRMRVLVRDAWQPMAGDTENRHRFSLRGGDRRLVTTGLLPQRRGVLRTLGVTVRSTGPLGCAGKQQTFTVAGELRALPRFDARRHLPSRLARLQELDGRSAVRVRGQGTEFDSLRDYVRGDDVRSIDWRASSRARNVVVRTWQPERDRRVVLVVDTSRTSAGRVGDVPRLDAALEATQLLTALASRAGDRVDVVAGSNRVTARLKTAGPSALADVSRGMSDLQPEIVEADWRTLAGAVNALGRQRSLLVLLTPLDPAPLEEGLIPLLPVLTRHHQVVLASVRDPELDVLAAQRDSIEDVHTAAAAQQVLARRAHTATILKRLGVDVLDADVEALPPALADHYLALKAAGRL